MVYTQPKARARVTDSVPTQTQPKTTPTSVPSQPSSSANQNHVVQVAKPSTGVSTPNTADISSKIDEYMAMIQKSATQTADANLQAQQNLIQSQLKNELEQAGVDTAKVEKDYSNQLENIDQNTFSEMKDQQVESTSRGLLQTNQQIGFEQGINARANSTKYKVYQDRETRLGDIQARIASLRNTANTNMLNAQIQRDNAVSATQLATYQNQAERLQGLEKSQTDFGYQSQLQDKQFTNQQKLQDDNQAFEKEQTEVNFQNRLKEMGVNEAIQVRMAKLDQQQKKEILGMQQAAQKELMAMDTAAKKALMNKEFAMKKEFMALEEASQIKLMNNKSILDEAQLKKQIQLEFLKTNPAFADVMMGTNSQKIAETRTYYEGLYKKLKSPFGALTLKNSTDPVLNQMLIDMTGKNALQLASMSQDKVEQLFTNYAQKDFENSANKVLNQLFSTQTSTKSTSTKQKAD